MDLGMYTNISTKVKRATIGLMNCEKGRPVAWLLESWWPDVRSTYMTCLFSEMHRMLHSKKSKNSFRNLKFVYSSEKQLFEIYTIISTTLNISPNKICCFSNKICCFPPIKYVNICIFNIKYFIHNFCHYTISSL